TAVIRDTTGFALVAQSDDHGHSFTPAMPSNLPMVNSKPFAGTLSSGQRYVIFNMPPDRNRLLISVSEPGKTQVRRVWTLIAGTPAALRPTMDALGEGHGAHAWAYPEAIEHDGTLHVVFSHNKR